MKSMMLASAIAFPFLSGCGIGGYWMNGNPYGDSIIPTMFDEWTYPGGTTAEKMRQWVECGGSSKGYYRISSEGLTDEEYTAASRKKSRQLQTCMLDMGYRYIGQCESEVMMDSPACHERTLDKRHPHAEIMPKKSCSNRGLHAAHGLLLHRVMHEKN